MSATKILWGQITIVFLIILATTWGATQYVASSLGYQAQLGPPWFVMFGVPIYYPPAIFWWWYFYEAYAPPIFIERSLEQRANSICGVLCSSPCIMLGRGCSHHATLDVSSCTSGPHALLTR